MAERLSRTIQIGTGAGTWAHTLCWSPDGSRLAVGSAGEASNVHVLTVEGRVLWRAKAGDVQVIGLAWSPDGSRIAAASNSGSLALLDAASGTSLRTVTGFGRVRGVAWSPDSSRVVAVNSRSSTPPGSVFILDASSGGVQVEGVLDSHRPWGVDWSPDGRRIVVGFGNDEPPEVLDARTAGRLATLSDSACAVSTNVRWSPDGTRVAVAGNEPGWSVCDPDSGRRLVRGEGGRGVTYYVAWSAGGRVVATGGLFEPPGGEYGESRHVADLWDSASGRELACLSGHTDYLGGVAFAPDGRVLASASRDGTIRLWDVSDLCGTPEKAPATWATGPDGPYLARQLATVGRRPTATAAPAGLDLWVPTGLPAADPATECLGLLPDVAHQAIDLYADGRHLVGAVKGTRRWAKWSLATGARVWEADGPPADQGLVAAVSPDGERVAVTLEIVVEGGSTGYAADRPGGPVSLVPARPNGGGGSPRVAWSADGRRRVWATYGGHGVFVEDVTTGTCRGRSRGRARAGGGTPPTGRRTAAASPPERSRLRV